MPFYNVVNITAKLYVWKNVKNKRVIKSHIKNNVDV